MNELTAAGKLAAQMGGLGVLVVFAFFFYRLLDKYGAAFLAAQQASAGAMADLAAAVKSGQQDQRDVLIAVRVLADRMEAQKGYLVSIEREVQEIRMAKGVGA